MAFIVFYCVWCCCWWFTMRNTKLLTIPNDVQKPTKFVLFKTSYLFCCLFVTLTPIRSTKERNRVTASAGVWLSLCLACWLTTIQPFLLGSCSTCQMFCLTRMKRLWMGLKHSDATYWGTRNISGLMKVFYLPYDKCFFFFKYLLWFRWSSTHTQHISLIRWLLFREINHWQTSCLHAKRFSYSISWLILRQIV